MKNLPTAFQRTTLWTAITALSMTVIGAIAVGFIYLTGTVLSFLQPILVPFAVAGVLAYLLEPGVKWFEKRGYSRQKSVSAFFVVFSAALLALTLWIAPKVIHQIGEQTKRIPEHSQKARNAVFDFAIHVKKKFGIELLPETPLIIQWLNAAGKNAEDLFGKITSKMAGIKKLSISGQKQGNSPAAPPPEPSPVSSHTKEPKTEAEEVAESNFDLDVEAFLEGKWMKSLTPYLWSSAKTGVGGFIGVLGFLLSFVIVPLYLYYFLIESAKIKEAWSDYLPLRASSFKDEVVSCLTEINGYLIAFFRGQLFVSVINGIATGIGLMVLGLDFGLLIGLALCVLGIIPYLGIAMCWIPAVIIASVQGGGSFIPADPWWAMPLAVTAVFVIVQQIDGFFITPRIVGEAVGLHPMTVIASVLVWALLLGGLLGAILAVPMTASVKVLFQRYIWRARIAPQTVGGARQQHGEAGSA
ncbi:MAG: AI-2E family transporter [Verrucomicrobiaceae bacterium]|nr:AI-2E family transporter [Verrucomicrobiaceae bacterium]